MSINKMNFVESSMKKSLRKHEYGYKEICFVDGSGIHFTNS